jgi:hypothetical protein
MPKKPMPKKEKRDDKPWPRNVQIAGYVAGAIFIPYTAVWFILSNPTLREMFQNILPLDQLRTHFGEVEWDAQSYADKEELLDTGYHHFPLEWSFRDRKMEQEIKKRDATTLTANLYLLGNHEMQQTKQVKASTMANRQNLQEVFGLSSTDAKAPVAVDFQVDAPDEVDEFELTEDFLTQEDPTLQLRKHGHTFSSWYHVSAPNQAQEQQPTMSQIDYEVSRLEYTIAELEKNLKDPNCTRDIDDLTTELRDAKRDVSKLKWKRRLGMQ